MKFRFRCRTMAAATLAAAAIVWSFVMAGRSARYAEMARRHETEAMVHSFNADAAIYSYRRYGQEPPAEALTRAKRFAESAADSWRKARDFARASKGSLGLAVRRSASSRAYLGTRPITVETANAAKPADQR
ncbi:hypothetical protein [Paludisphaera soli]|uniref:hypothetical protein n=1 Tax=Paludisphaera soli TaxID=2712865 RepID=UPI0013EA25B7|nr:hypothetical protein [Paludisphaera soli]